MLKFIETDAVALTPMIKHIIMMLKYGKKSGNSLWAESNGTKNMVTTYYNSLSSEDNESLRNIFSKIGFTFEKEYDIIKFKKDYVSTDTRLTDQQKEILKTLFGHYGRDDIFREYPFSAKCDRLLRKIASWNELNFNILNFVEEGI